MVEIRKYWLLAGSLIIVGIVIAATSFDGNGSSHVLRFGIFESGSMKYYIADGDVYLNNVFMGRTNKGILEADFCSDGEIEFKPDIGFQLKENDRLRFNINCNSLIHDFSLANKEKIVSELSVANKFIPLLVYDNTLIRKNAVEIINNCEQNDKACMTYEIFNTIKNNIKYVEDARDAEHAQTVAKTLNIKAADCEDFTIILSSYLESIGIKSIMLLTNSHIYTLSCGLDHDKVSRLVPAGKPFFWYEIDNERCYVVDPTIPGSYMGYSANILGEKIAVDPINKNYYILDKQD